MTVSSTSKTYDSPEVAQAVQILRQMIDSVNKESDSLTKANVSVLNTADIDGNNVIEGKEETIALLKAQNEITSGVSKEIEEINNANRQQMEQLCQMVMSSDASQLDPLRKALAFNPQTAKFSHALSKATAKNSDVEIAQETKDQLIEAFNQVAPFDTDTLVQQGMMTQNDADLVNDEINEMMSDAITTSQKTFRENPDIRQDVLDAPEIGNLTPLDHKEHCEVQTGKTFGKNL